MKRFVGVSLLLFSLFLAGCSDSKPAGGTATNTGDAPPPPPPPIDKGSDNKPAKPEGSSSSTAPPSDTQRGPVTILSLLTPDHFAAARFNVQGLLQSSIVKTLPAHEQSQIGAMLREIAHVPQSGEQIMNGELGVQNAWALVSPQAQKPGVPFDLTVVVEFASQDDLARIFALDKIAQDPENVSYNGQFYFMGPDGLLGWIVNDRIVCITTSEEAMKRVIDHRGIVPDTPLAKKMQSFSPEMQVVVAGSLDPLRGFLASIPKEGLPPEAQQHAGMIDYVDSFAVAIDLDGPMMFKSEIVGVDAEKAAELRQLVNFSLTTAKAFLASAKSDIEKQGLKAAVEMHGIGEEAVNGIQTSIDDRTVVVSMARPASLARLPDLIEARMAEIEGEMEKARPMHNAQMLADAGLQLRMSRIGERANMRSNEGEHLLSWRLYMLNFYSDDLFGEFHRDEAWDSPHNRPLAENTPALLQTRHADSPGHTTWRLVTNYAGDIMFIDAGRGKSVVWSEPDIFTIDPNDPLASLGEEPENGYIVIFRNGQVRQMTGNEIVEHFKTKAAGQPEAE